MKNDSFEVSEKGENRKYNRIICKYLSKSKLTAYYGNKAYKGYILNFDYECAACLIEDLLEFELKNSLIDFEVTLENNDYSFSGIITMFRLMHPENRDSYGIFIINYKKNSTIDEINKIHNFINDLVSSAQ